MTSLTAYFEDQQRAARERGSQAGSDEFEQWRSSAASTASASSLPPARGGRAGAQGESEVARLCGDLRTALRQADGRRRQARERLDRFELAAAREERDLAGRLAAAKLQLASRRVERELAMEAQAQRLRAEVREVESERDAMLQAASKFEVELQHVRATSRPAAGTAADAGAAEAVEAEAEASALQAVLGLAEQRRGGSFRAHEREVEEEVLQAERAQQREEAQAQDAAEQRLRVGQACVADALAMHRAGARPRAGDRVSAETLAESEATLEEHWGRCQELEASLRPMHDECNQLLELTSAAEAKVMELERRLSDGGLKAAVERALARLRRADRSAREAGGEAALEGAQRLVLVLACICGSPRIAYLVLDFNRSGRVSISEFDAGLRLRFGMDYEAITGLKLRPLFRGFDQQKRGVLVEEDIASCCPEQWAQFGAPGDANADAASPGPPAGGARAAGRARAASSSPERTPAPERAGAQGRGDQ